MHYFYPDRLACVLCDLFPDRGSNKEITTVRSDKYQLLVVGEDFYVKANNTERRGWVVSTAVCRDGDGPMPENAASRKIKWLGKHAKNNNCIDLVQSDDD